MDMVTTSKRSFTDEDREKAQILLDALEPFRQIRSTMPMQYVVAFLLTVIHEGEGVTELARRAGVSQSVMSRHLLDIGPRNRYGTGDGFNLVMHKINPLELRKHEICPTDRGRRTWQAVKNQLNRFSRRGGGHER